MNFVTAKVDFEDDFDKCETQARVYDELRSQQSLATLACRGVSEFVIFLPEKAMNALWYELLT